MSRHDGRPLSEVRRELRRARDELRPSVGFAGRLEEALIAQEAREAEAPSVRRESSVRPWSELPFVLSAALAAMVALFISVDTPVFDDFRVHERALELDLAAGGSVPLDLALHHHGPDEAAIEVHAPRSLEVADHDGDLLEPHTCQADHCRYELARPGDGPNTVHVSVSRPGRYRMEVEHRSAQARVREVFVIHARR